MSDDPSPARRAEWTADAASDQESFTRTVDHAKLAYANTQEVIRFVDLKSNVLIALSTVISGGAIAFAKWNFELPHDSSIKVQALILTHPCLATTAAILFALSLVATVVSYLAATWSLIARPAAPGAFTVLFPVPRDLDRPSHRKLICERLAGLSREGILQEFNEQLAAVGRILQSKLKSSRIAAITVITQLALLTIAVLIYVYLAARS
jgi:hypothetical protein